MSIGNVTALHLHTYFLFPFAIDIQTVVEQHGEIWTSGRTWIAGLDDWIASEGRLGNNGVIQELGRWKRASYTRLDLESKAYENVVFFHPFVRRVFFDIQQEDPLYRSEQLLRCYTIPVEGRGLHMTTYDFGGEQDSIEVTDLRLFLFANGIGILSIGVEEFGTPVKRALRINEAMRKVYPSSGRQIREHRIAQRVAFEIRDGERRHILIDHDFRQGSIKSFRPPLSRTITELLYFAAYDEDEYAPVFDERMIVYTYAALDPASVPQNFRDSDEYRILISRFLYVDREGESFRYEPDFIKQQMHQQVYRRWAHQGTYYGFTGYSSISITIGTFDCDDHRMAEGFLVHRMFDTRYYLMTLAALFYRATLLELSERSAIVSKELTFREGRPLTLEDLELSDELRSDFLHFNSYWYFEEMANKDEEIEHFDLQCQQYRIKPMMDELAKEIEALNASVHSYQQLQNTEAVNRLGIVTMLLGVAAVVTGFFGMNFEREFAGMFFTGNIASGIFHYLAQILVTMTAFGVIALGTLVIGRNWADYRRTLLPTNKRRVTRTGRPIKRL
jgi:hypothetical protein